MLEACNSGVCAAGEVVSGVAGGVSSVLGFLLGRSARCDACTDAVEPILEASKVSKVGNPRSASKGRSSLLHTLHEYEDVYKEDELIRNHDLSTATSVFV